MADARREDGSGGHSHASATDPVLDTTVLAEIRELDPDGGDEAVGQLVQLFVHHTDRELDSLRQAVADSQHDRIGVVAHSLKGSSGNMGAARMAGLCHQLEQAAAGSDSDAAARLVGPLEVEFARVRTALMAEVGLA